jgi:hypothetical protein
MAGRRVGSSCSGERAAAVSAERKAAHAAGGSQVTERIALHFCGSQTMTRLAVRWSAAALRRLALSVLAGAVAVLTACGAPSPSQSEAKQQASERLARAEAMFKERCQKAGQKIHRTVDNVEGVFLLKIRPDRINFGSQFELSDPYGDDHGGSAYIETFLRGSHQATHRGTPAPGSPPRIGYLYVEAIDPADGKRYRYTGRIEEPWQNDKRYLKGYMRFVIDKVPAPGKPPRYGVTYDDLSTREEREYWIAGSSLRVIDLQTNEVIAERIGYMMDRGQGSRAGERQPWLLAAAHACPTFQRNPNLPLTGPASAAQTRQTQDFVEKVLKPKQEN